MEEQNVRVVIIIITYLVTTLAAFLLRMADRNVNNSAETVISELLHTFFTTAKTQRT